jgi:alginate export protein
MRTTVIAALGMVAVAAGRAEAEEPAGGLAERLREHLTFTVSERVRGEFVDWFQAPPNKAPPGAQRYNFMGNQLRVGAQLDVPHALFTVQMQDTRLVNLPDDASPPVSKAGNLGPGAVYFSRTHQRDQGEPFLKLANLTVKDVPGAPGLSLTGGRFEYSDGLETIPADAALAWLKRARIGERLVGPSNFGLVSRSVDGVRGIYDTADVNVTALGVVPTQGVFEVSANRELSDVWLAGLAVTLKQLDALPPTDARVFYLYYQDGRHDAVKVDNRPQSARESDRDAIVIHTWGMHAVTVADAGPGKIDGLIWAVVQAGDWGQLDHFGWAYALETGYQVPQLWAAPWVRFGYDRSSGDDDPNDKTHHTFFQILPTSRAYAQFPFFNLMNNEDLFAQLITRPYPGITMRSDYHWLRLTNSADLWYSGAGADNNQTFGFAGLPAGDHRELAHLVDLSATISLYKQLVLYAYYGRAFGQSVVRNTFAGSTANFAYVELTVRN